MKHVPFKLIENMEIILKQSHRKRWEVCKVPYWQHWLCSLSSSSLRRSSNLCSCTRRSRFSC